MPLYDFQNIKTNEVKEFFFPMNRAPKIGETVDIEGKKWTRLVSARINGVVKGSDNPTANDFVAETKNKKGNIGDLLDRSRELSEKRKKIYGEDKIQNKYFDDWSAKRSGKAHEADTRPRKTQKLKIKK